MAQDLNQMQLGDFPAGYFSGLLANDMGSLFGNSPPVSSDPLLDTIDVFLQQGSYHQGFELSELDSIVAAGPVHPYTQTLDFTPYSDYDTFDLLDASGDGGPPAVCTGIPPLEQGQPSYPPVFDLEEYLASLDQPQLAPHAPIEASSSDYEENPQDILSLFGSSPFASQRGDHEEQPPTGFENFGLVLPAKGPLPPSTRFPGTATIPPSPKVSPEEGFTLRDNGGPSNLTDLPGDQEIATIIPKSLAPTSHLRITGKVSAMQKIKDSTEEVPVLYSVYEPLKPWAEFKYTTRGHLHEDIVFDKESMQRFVRGMLSSQSPHPSANKAVANFIDHPNGDRLNLRIEKHPYSFQCRYREPEYIKCRSKVCDWDQAFKVGDHRVAIDEVTGRFAEDQQDDNDPYFSAGYLHLHCFERLIPVAPLVVFNILAPDNRRIYEKEPDCTRINKMGVSPASASAFANWRIEAVQGYSVSGDWMPGETLAYALWLSGVRKGRKRVRAPPGITSHDIAQKVAARRGWGGKRCAGVTVATMRAMESQGLSHAMVASRNGKTGKKGVKLPSETKKRARSYSIASQTTQCAEESLSEFDAALAKPPAKKIKRARGEFKIAEDPVATVTFNSPIDLSQIQGNGKVAGPPGVSSQALVSTDIGQIHDIEQLLAEPVSQTMIASQQLQNSIYGIQYPNIDPNLGYLESLDSVDWSGVPLAGDEDWDKENIDPALLQMCWALPPQQTSTQFSPPVDNSQALEQQGWTLTHTQGQYHQPPPPPAMPATKKNRRSTHRPTPITIPAPVSFSTSTPITVLAPTPKCTTAVPNLASRSLSPIPWTAPTTTTHRRRQGYSHRRPQPAATYMADRDLQQRQQQRQNSTFFPTPTFPPALTQAPYTPTTQAQPEAQGFDNARAYPRQKTPGEPVAELSGINPFELEFAEFESGNGDQNTDALLTREQMSYIEDWFGGQGL